MLGQIPQGVLALRFFLKVLETNFLLLTFQSTPDYLIKTLRNLKGLCA